jgi:hypothetical protein
MHPHQEWNFDIDAFDQLPAFDQDKVILCCCKNDIPHDESMKFVIKATEENLQICPFQNKPNGKLTEENANIRKMSNRHFNQNEVFYRNSAI